MTTMASSQYEIWMNYWSRTSDFSKNSDPAPRALLGVWPTDNSTWKNKLYLLSNYIYYKQYFILWIYWKMWKFGVQSVNKTSSRSQFEIHSQFHTLRKLFSQYKMSLSFLSSHFDCLFSKMKRLMVILIFAWFDYLGIFEQYFIISNWKIVNYFCFWQTKSRFCLFKN